MNVYGLSSFHFLALFDCDTYNGYLDQILNVFVKLFQKQKKMIFADHGHITENMKC